MYYLVLNPVLKFLNGGTREVGIASLLKLWRNAVTPRNIPSVQHSLNSASDVMPFSCRRAILGGQKKKVVLAGPVLLPVFDK